MANIMWTQVVGRISKIKFVWLLDMIVQHKYLYPVSFFTSMQDGIRPVYAASKNGHKEVVDIQVHAGADINLATTVNVDVSTHTVSSSVAAVVEPNVRLIEFIVYDLYFHRPHSQELKYALLDEFFGWMAHSLYILFDGLRSGNMICMCAHVLFVYLYAAFLVHQGFSLSLAFSPLSFSLSLSLFSSSYEGGPATCAYWGARNPRRTTCNGDQEPEIIEQSESITIWHLRCILS